MEYQEAFDYESNPIDSIEGAVAEEEQMREETGLYPVESVAVRSLSSPVPMEAEVEYVPIHFRPEPYPEVFDAYITHAAPWALQRFCRAWRNLRFAIPEVYELSEAHHYREVDGIDRMRRYMLCCCEGLALACVPEPDSLHVIYVFPDGEEIDEDDLKIPATPLDSEEEEEYSDTSYSSDVEEPSPVWEEDNVVLL